MPLSTSMLLLLGLAQGAGSPAIAPDGYLKTPIAGLERTGAVETISGSTRLIQIRKSNPETNATQLTIANSGTVAKGDILALKLTFRGRGSGDKPARIEVMFEKATSPWLKSFTQSYESSPTGKDWKNVSAVFKSAESYSAGQAMLSIRLATQIQTVELAAVALTNLGPDKPGRTLEDMREEEYAKIDLGTVNIVVNPDQRMQTMEGLGGNFCQPRYGSTEAMDAVGQYCLDKLDVRNGRVGIPLNHWNPAKGVYKAEGQAEASMKAMAILKKKGMPVTASVWEPGRWMLGGNVEESGRDLDPALYPDCVNALIEYVRYAKKHHDVEPDYISFNEPDIGINVKFSPAQMISFVKQWGTAADRAGIKTKFLVADSANGNNLYELAHPMLEDASIAKYLGPIAFHCWDSLSASAESYDKIKQLGLKYKKPVWCMEAGHDAQLWQQENAWGTWENAIRTALAYERTLRLTGASVMSYWTYQDNYTLVDPKTMKPHASFKVMQGMDKVFGAGQTIVSSTSSSQGIVSMASVSGTGTRAMLVAAEGKANVVLAGLPKD
ncbi:MAG TPA: hypothetical protein VK171_13150, partial [Fimbriimonas sp.]|nr:hypothetical protein [Fimbriimonas sp.]